MKDKPNWSKFEDATHKVTKKLYPRAKVTKDVHIEGILSKSVRQIDVTVEPDQYDILAIECKDYGRNIDVSTVEQFNTKLQDIGAKRGAIVSNSGYSRAARNMAGALKIDLLNLIDTKNKSVKGKLYTHTLLSDSFVRNISLGISITAPTTSSFSLDPTKITLISSDGRNAASDIFKALWNNPEGPFAQTPGHWRYTLTNAQHIKILGSEGDEVPLDKLVFHYEVYEKHFRGKVEIKEAQGLYNVNSGSFTTREMITERVNPSKVEKIWEEISQEEREKTKGQYGFEMSVKSLFTL